MINSLLQLPPAIGIALGMILLGITLLINVVGGVKAACTQWIGRVIYRQDQGSDMMAKSMFRVITSILGAAGAVLVIWNF